MHYVYVCVRVYVQSVKCFKGFRMNKIGHLSCRLTAAAGIQHTCLAALYAVVRSISGFIHDINRVAVGH